MVILSEGIIKYFEIFYQKSSLPVKELAHLAYFGFEKTILQLMGTLSLNTIIKKLKLESSKCRRMEDYISLVYSFNFYSLINIRPQQIKEEIIQFMKILAKFKPKNILEIGTARGGTLYLWSRVADPNAILISIDLPIASFYNGYPKWKMPFYQSFALDNQKIFLLRKNSHKASTLSEVKNILGNKKIDFLFIDGDHSYEGVKKDFEMYSKLVRRGGIIAFHDIVPSRCGVYRFWLELKNKI
jgi:cephalosporin hydroxylase